VNWVSQSDFADKQLAVCLRFGAKPYAAPSGLKVGVAPNVRKGILPLNGLRREPDPGTAGWFIWAGGEPSSDPDFFLPLHIDHLDEWCPSAMPYLQLPPGYRFQVAPGHEEVWFDPSLLAP
jgi:hypothetical protein